MTQIDAGPRADTQSYPYPKLNRALPAAAFAGNYDILQIIVRFVKQNAGGVKNSLLTLASGPAIVQGAGQTIARGAGGD
jgi:hypothetical protein